jgi:RNA polymerase sigma-70 factor (ECF subfamily)
LREALALTNGQGEAEDLVQETYVYVLGAGDRMATMAESPTKLLHVMRLLWSRQLRRLAQESHLSDCEANLQGMASRSDKADPLAIYMKAMEKRALWDAITNLPEEAQEVILLRDFDGQSYRAIAERLHCPVGTVMSRLGRARFKLRTALSTDPSTSIRGANS